jgi:25S rRNA (cytosine2870-C5)-methyltransferase
VITRDPSIKAKRTLKDFKEHACIQKKLLTAAVDLCSAASTTGGYIVYSTCSLSVEENEEVIVRFISFFSIVTYNTVLFRIIF